MPPTFDPQPVTLSAPHVRLEPIGPRHAADLYVAGQDAEIWTYLPYAPFATVGDAERWVRELAAEQAGGTVIGFAQVDPATGRAFGSTRYLDIQRKNRGLEIGGTWLGKSHRRTAANTEAKYLLLRHAFEALGAIRVQLKTDARNVRSQQGILRIGAKQEGVLRQHMVMPDGYLRDSVYFSILDREWPAVKAGLEARMGGGLS